MARTPLAKNDIRSVAEAARFFGEPQTLLNSLKKYLKKDLSIIISVFSLKYEKEKIDEENSTCTNI